MKILARYFLGLLFFLCGVYELNAQSVLPADSVISLLLQPEVKNKNLEERFEKMLSGLAVEDEVEDRSKLAELYSFLGTDLWNLGLREQSLIYLQKGIDLSKSSGADPLAIYMRTGTKVAYLLAMDSAESALELALGSLEAIRRFDTTTIATAQNNVGLCYLKLNEFELAKAYFDSSLVAMDRIWRGRPKPFYLELAVRNNLADNEARNGRLDQAIELVSQNLDMIRQRENKDDYWCSKYVSYSLEKSKLEIHNGNWNAAITPLDSLRSYFSKHPEMQTKKHALSIAEMEYELAALVGDAEAETQASRAVLNLAKQVDEERSERQLSSIQRLSKITLDKTKREYQKSLQLSEQKLRFRTLMLLFIGFVSALLLGTGYLINKVRLQQRQMQNQRLEMELRHKNRDIGNLAMDISRRKQVTEEVLSYIDELKANSSGKPTPVDLKNIEKDLKKRIKADEKREWVHTQVEDINSAFYDRLRTKYPALVPTELELCALIRSGMSNKEIAEIRNISPGSARKARYRLGRKLGVPEGKDLVGLLNEI
ncbi:MAG: hypothetical protein H6601_08970 [Flavobacteriales bacterium]|nr:hypothetical protein [Flavobacteriales bacterium]